jgi:hypothetical protein
MRDLYKSIDYIQRGVLRGLDRKPASSLPKGMLPKGIAPKGIAPKGVAPKPSIRAWRAPIASDVVYPEQVFRPRVKPGDQPKDPSRDTSRDPPRDNPKSTSMTKRTLSARALKITVPLDPAEVAALPAPDGQARSQLAVTCDGKIYTADIATKSLRKAKGTISANGAENVFVMVQGKLRGNEIVECGLVAQVKAPKPAEAMVG